MAHIYPTASLPRELINLLPRPQVLKETESPRPNKSLPEEWTFDPTQVRLDNVLALVENKGFASALISEGPWMPGALIDGEDEIAAAKQLCFPVRAENVKCPDLLTAKKLRWAKNVSATQISTPPFAVVRAFLTDPDFTAYFDGLKEKGKQRMSEGGKRARKGEKPLEVPGFNYRLVASRFCGVKSHDFQYAVDILKAEKSIESFGELAVDVARQIRRAEIGEVSCRNVAVEIKNLKADQSREKHLEHSKDVPNKATTLPTKWDSSLGNVVYHGDCFTLLPQVGDREIDRIVTSPDYFNANIQYGDGDIRPKTWPEYSAKMKEFCTQCWRILKDDGMLIINLSDTTEDSRIATGEDRLREFYDHRGLVMGIMLSLGCISRQPKIWDKGDTYAKKSRWGSQANPSHRADCEHIMIFQKGKRKGGVGWVLDKDETKKYTMGIWHCIAQPDNSRRDDRHPCIWPHQLHRPLYGIGAKRGDKIMDPFSGVSGMLADAASEGLVPIGIEKNGTWAERGQKAILAGVQEWKDKKAKSIRAPEVEPDFEVPTVPKKGKNLVIDEIDVIDDEDDDDDGLSGAQIIAA